MVHDERHGQRQQARQQVGQHRPVHVQAQVPAQRRDQGDHVVEHGRVRRAAQVRHEVEARGAHAAIMQLLDAGRRSIRPQQGHAAIAPAALRQRIQQGAVVRAVAVGLHHHRALDAQVRMQRGHGRVRRIGRRVRPALGIREHIARPEHMAVRVASARRQRVARTGRRRKRRTAIGHSGFLLGKRHRRGLRRAEQCYIFDFRYR
ncbi:hypothetical protein D3C72_1184500 [compost metagenome]